MSRKPYIEPAVAGVELYLGNLIMNPSGGGLDPYEMEDLDDDDPDNVYSYGV